MRGHTHRARAEKEPYRDAHHARLRYHTSPRRLALLHGTLEEPVKQEVVQGRCLDVRVLDVAQEAAIKCARDVACV